MTATLPTRTVAPVLSDHAFVSIEIAMVIGIVVALIATYIVVKANKRLDQRIQARRAQRRAEAAAREIAIDALSGRERADGACDSAGAAEDK